MADTTEDAAPTSTLHDWYGNSMVRVFSYERGIPSGALRGDSFVVDCRNLPAPCYDDTVRTLSGKDPRVMQWLRASDPLRVDLLLRNALRALVSGRVACVYFGSNGFHRNVAMAAELWA